MNFPIYVDSNDIYMIQSIFNKLLNIMKIETYIFAVFCVQTKMFEHRSKAHLYRKSMYTYAKRKNSLSGGKLSKFLRLNQFLNQLNYKLN